jgi:hypothetical protein
MTVASDYAAYLKAPALYATVSTEEAALWPDGLRPERSSPFATIDGGVGEAARQALFVGGAKVRDLALVNGRRGDLLGKAIVGRGDRLGYEGDGAVVFVIGAQELDDNTTMLTVVGKL